jgi:hypothetical protein
MAQSIAEIWHRTFPVLSTFSPQQILVVVADLIKFYLADKIVGEPVMGGIRGATVDALRRLVNSLLMLEAYHRGSLDCQQFAHAAFAADADNHHILTADQNKLLQECQTLLAKGQSLDCYLPALSSSVTGLLRVSLDSIQVSTMVSLLDQFISAWNKLDPEFGYSEVGAMLIHWGEQCKLASARGDTAAVVGAVDASVKAMLATPPSSIWRSPKPMSSAVLPAAPVQSGSRARP